MYDSAPGRLRVPHTITVLLLVGSLVTDGCTTSALRIDKKAAELGLVRQIVKGTRFTHVAYSSTQTDSRILHIYLEGDGSPWIRPNEISTDPTPRHPVMFEMMALDAGRMLYLGRPCYHGLVDEALCTPWIWTHGRYSETVVDSLEAALRSFLQYHRAQRLRFFGFSGGGTLAVLLAKRFPKTEVVVTVAGNLDIDAWVQHHGYSGLEGSINPASMPPLDPRIRQLHLVGLRDEIIPPSLIERYVRQQTNSEVIRYPEFDHRCCWRDVWPSLLSSLR